MSVPASLFPSSTPSSPVPTYLYSSASISSSPSATCFSTTPDCRLMRSLAVQTDKPPLGLEDLVLAEHCARISEMNGPRQDGDELIREFGAINVVGEESESICNQQTDSAIPFEMPSSYPQPVPEHPEDRHTGQLVKPPTSAKHFTNTHHVGDISQTQNMFQISLSGGPTRCTRMPCSSSLSLPPSLPTPFPYHLSSPPLPFNIPRPPVPPPLPPLSSLFAHPPIPARATVPGPQRSPFFVPPCPQLPFLNIAPAPPPVPPVDWHPRPVPALLRHAPPSVVPPHAESETQPQFATYMPGPPPPELMGSYLERSVVRRMMTGQSHHRDQERDESVEQWVADLSSTDSGGFSSDGVYSDDNEDTLRERAKERLIRREKRRRRIQRLAEAREREAAARARQMEAFERANELARVYTPSDLHIGPPYNF